MALLTVTEKKPVLGFDQKVRTTVSDVRGGGCIMGNQADAVLGAKLSGKLLGPYLALGRGKQDCQRGK